MSLHVLNISVVAFTFNMATHSDKDKRCALNIYIFGEDKKAKCNLGYILTSSKYREFNNSNPMVRSVWSPYQKNTNIKVTVAPLPDSIRYKDLLNNMKCYRHRYILYVCNSGTDQVEETMQNIQLLQSHIGNFKTRYIPVIYRDQTRLHEPITHLESCFLQQFPYTHFHAPCIHERCDQKKSHMMLLDYIKLATNKEKACAFKEYTSDMFICYDTSNTLDNYAHFEHNVSDPSNSLHTSLDSINLSDTSKKHEADTGDEIYDDDMDIFEQSLAYGRTTQHHVRIMVVGPNGGGKTTLIKRLQLEPNCCDTYCPPTEGIKITKAQIRCRLVDGNLEWEAEKANARYGFDGGMLSPVPDDNQENVAYCATPEDHSSLDGNLSPCFSVSDSEFSLNSHSPSENSIDKEKERLATEATWHQNNETVPWTYCSFWDFAGHAAYYSTHQLFMSTSVIYLLVLNLSNDLDSQIDHLPDTKGIGMFQMTELESLKFWFGSIQQHVSDSAVSICLVATHKDKINKPTVISQKLKYISDELKVDLPCFVLDNTQSREDDLQTLKGVIESSAVALANETIPANWIELERNLEQMVQQGKYVIEATELIERFHRFGFKRKEVLSFLHYQHSKGELLFFSKESNIVRRSYEECSSSESTTSIFLDPMIMIQFINHILKRRPKEHFHIGLRLQHVTYSADGFLDDEYITDILERMYNGKFIEFKEYFMQELVALHILFKFKDGNQELMFMPCLLRQQPPDDIFQFQKAAETTSVLVIRFDISGISQAIFHQLVAALHKYYSPRKVTENNVDKMQFYCGYIIFKLSTSGLQLMQMIWKSNGIHLKILNFTRRTSLNTNVNNEGKTLSQAALDTTLDCLNEILAMYRVSLDYDLMVICPDHFMPPSFVPFDSLLEEDGCLCPSMDPHELTKERALQFWTSPNILKKQGAVSVVNEYDSCLTSKDIGRIVLNMEVNIYVLTYVLKIERSDADIVAYDYPQNTKMQMLRLMLKWKQKHGSQATFGVLRKILGKLIKRCEGDWISDVLRKGIQSSSYELLTDTLQEIPDDRTLSSCIIRHLIPGTLYFLFLELGLSPPAIEQANEHNRLFEAQAFELLKSWKQQEAGDATLQRLLDTAKYVGMDTTPMVNAIKWEQTKLSLLSKLHDANV